MRINKYVAQATGLSRRAADATIAEGRVEVNGSAVEAGYVISPGDNVVLDGQTLVLDKEVTTVMLNKPVGYICSRDGQGSKTIYDLLPPELHHLKPVGRLDKDSSGLLLLTNDGELAHQLTHPSFQKEKVYGVTLDKPLADADKSKIEQGADIGDKQPSSFNLKKLDSNRSFEATLTEGRNRQIRRTFEALGYQVIRLHRTKFGKYELKALSTAHHCYI